MQNTSSNSSNLTSNIDIMAYQHYIKVQEAHPTHHSNLINKELAYDCVIDTKDDGIDSVKLINCTNSARPNSEVYKRLAKKLISSMKNGVDQLFFFSSLNALARLETSIGLATNPGIFLIIGLTFLDEKYKEYHQRCEVEFSFMQCRDGQMFDLLCYTKQPLMPSSEGGCVSFQQHWAKTTTFNQFIKLFKIALFNNKERDLQYDTQKINCNSTFIMKIRRKIYNENGQIINQQQTVLVDYQPNSKQTNKQKGNSRSLFDLILIAVNNSHPSNKPIHCHLVEQPLLLQIVRKYLPKHHSEKEGTTARGQISFITSFPADKAQFSAHHAYIQNIETHLGQKFKMQVRTRSTPHRIYNLQQLDSQLVGIVQGLIHNSYSSLKRFHQLKHIIVSQVKKVKQNLRELRKVISSYLRGKVQRQFLVNELVSYEYKLIGSCIKSDHFKDFYHAKSYLQLQREVEIKTSSVKEEIVVKDEMIHLLEKKFIALKNKSLHSYQKYKDKDSVEPNKQIQLGTMTLMNSAKLWNAYKGDSKFKKLANILVDEQTQKTQLEATMAELYFYFHDLWQIITMNEERTVGKTLELEQQILQQQKRMFEILSKFVDSVEDICESDITYEQQNCRMMNNKDIYMHRSAHFLGLLGPKKVVNGYEISKRLMLTNNKHHPQKNNARKSKHTKLPSIQTTKQIVISGDIRLSELLLTPQVPSSETHQQ